MTRAHDKLARSDIQQQIDEALAARIAAAKTLADIAKIPHSRRAAFCDEAVGFISLAISDACLRKIPPTMARQFKELEAAIHATHCALSGLSNDGRFVFAGELWEAYHLLHHRLDFPPPLVENRRERAWRSAGLMMRAMALAAGRVANKDPRRKKGKGGRKNWTLLAFVRALWHCADRHGGELTANCKNNVRSGSMFHALEALRPCFAAMPEGIAKDFIRPVPPAQTIANMVNAERKKTRRH
jgi:hypothetical protein